MIGKGFGVSVESNESKSYSETYGYSKDESSCSPGVIYTEDGHMIMVFLKSEPYFAEWVTHALTIYRSDSTKEVIGFSVSLWNLVPRSNS